MKFEDLSRQRLDFRIGPEGEQIATLTVTLQDGSEHVFEDSTTEEEVDSFAAALASEEVRHRKIEGHWDEEEIAGLFSFIGKAVKAVGGLAKKIVTSKVFKTAAKGLAAIAPVLGPLAPVALGVSGAMAVTSKLTSAATAASGGAKRSAKKLTKAAIKEAGRHVKSAKARKAMLRVANKKRKNASRLIASIPGVSLRRRPTGAARGLRRRKSPPSVFKAAKAGRLRSLKMGTVSPKKLKKAMKGGRVFWIARAA